MGRLNKLEAPSFPVGQVQKEAGWCPQRDVPTDGVYPCGGIVVSNSHHCLSLTAPVFLSETIIALVAFGKLHPRMHARQSCTYPLKRFLDWALTWM